MTTIAYRDGVMAADTGVWMGGACLTGAVKIAKGADGCLHGVAGHAGACCDYLEWVKNGERGDAPQPERANEESTFIALCVNVQAGTIRLLTAYGVEHLDGVPYVSIGSGAAAALGAMFAGADAEQAIRAAMAHTEGARGDVICVCAEGC